MKNKKKMMMTAMAAALTISLSVMPASFAEAADTATTAKWQSISWEDTIKPALEKTTDVNTVYRELKLGIQYKVLSEGNIRHLYEDEDTKLPIEAIQKLYQDGYVSGYLYKLLSGGTMTQEDMSAVFQADYYYNNNKDIQASVGTDGAALFQHFLANGMKEGRPSSATFNLAYYKANYPDLVKLYGNDNAAYYQHYLLYGKFEGRVADKLTSNK